MRKKLLITCFCLSMGCLFLGCSKNSNRITESTQQENTSKMEVISAPVTTFSTESTSSQIKAKIQLFEGNYFDERVYSYVDVPDSSSPLIYCEIKVSNITETSFDFSIDQKTVSTGKSINIFPESTAVFTGDGTEASCQAGGQTINFLFPADQDLYPLIRNINVNGLDELEGNTYINNSIPGHEAG